LLRTAALLAGVPGPDRARELGHAEGPRATRPPRPLRRRARGAPRADARMRVASRTSRESAEDRWAFAAAVRVAPGPCPARRAAAAAYPVPSCLRARPAGGLDLPSAYVLLCRECELCRVTGSTPSYVAASAVPDGPSTRPHAIVAGRVRARAVTKATRIVIDPIRRSLPVEARRSV